MNNLTKAFPDAKELKFRKMLKRDAILLLVISMVCSIGIVVVAICGAKYNW